jgi:hypothetical protein
MNTWTSDELQKIEAEEELDISVRRRDDTLRNPVTIWVVRVGDDLYVRSWRGRDGAWFRAIQVSHQGRILAGDVQKDVTLSEVIDLNLNDRIDNAYLAKYGRYPQYVAPMVAAEARSTTLRVVPRAKTDGAK